jgi:hypothetical protein
MNKEIVLDFSPSGGAEAMHFDHFPLSFLGKMKVTRASEIVFNQDTQSWDAHIFGSGTLIVEDFPGYGIARHFEVEFVQTCRKIRQYPNSRFCAFIAKSLRTEIINDLAKSGV